MDVLRSCYQTRMRFYKGDTTSARVRWYFVPPHTPTFPYATPFVSGVYTDHPPGQSSLGEALSKPGAYDKGTPPTFTIVPRPCGTLSQFLSGASQGTPGLLRRFDGISLCCLQGVPQPDMWGGLSLGSLAVHAGRPTGPGGLSAGALARAAGRPTGPGGLSLGSLAVHAGRPTGPGGLSAGALACAATLLPKALQYGKGNEVNGVGTITNSWTASTTAGNVLVLALISSAAPSAAPTGYTLYSTTTIFSVLALRIYIATGATSRAAETINFGVNVTAATVSVEISQLPVGALDVASTAGTGNSSSAATGNTAGLAGVPEMGIAVVGSAVPVVPSSISAWTNGYVTGNTVGGVTNTFAAIGVLVLTSTSATGTTATLNRSDNWAAQVLAFK